MRLFLHKSGVDFDVAFSLGDNEAIAWAVALGEMDGNEFDWNSFRWKKRE